MTGASRREVGLGIQGDRLPGAYAPLARAAEEFGFDVLSVFGDLLFVPPLVPLLEMAAATSRIRLGAACYNPYTLHPYEIAGQVAALDTASAGRGYLGLARGTWLGGIGVAQPRPMAHLEQALALIRALLRGDDRGIDAEFYPLEPGIRLRYPVPDHPPRTLIGTWGPATAALAGRVADEVKIGGTANPAMVAVMRQWIAVGLDRAGRSEDEVGLAVGAVTVVDDDGDRRGPAPGKPWRCTWRSSPTWTRRSPLIQNCCSASGCSSGPVTTRARVASWAATSWTCSRSPVHQHR